jgi:hypothetical protein
MRDRLLQIQARLEAKAPEEAQRVGRSVKLLDRFFGRHDDEDPSEPEKAVTASRRKPKRRIKSKVPQRQRRVQGAPPDLPADCKKYYEECKKKPPKTVSDKGADRIESYCSRVAWQICCQAGKGGDHCTELGLTKKRGPIEE